MLTAHYSTPLFGNELDPALVRQLQQQINRFAFRLSRTAPNLWHFSLVPLSGIIDEPTADAVLKIGNFNLNRLTKEAKATGSYDAGFEQAMRHARFELEASLMMEGRVGTVKNMMPGLVAELRELADSLQFSPQDAPTPNTPDQPAPSTPDQPTPPAQRGLSAGAKIALGVGAGVALLGGLFVVLRRQHA